MKILVVEDDKSVADMVRLGLLSDSHTVDMAYDGAEGSFLARNYDYDAMVLDYSLPKKDGLAICQEVRKAGKSTPIIFLSMTADVPLKVSALGIGADDYMTKPFSMEELLARVRALGRRPNVLQQPILKLADLVVDLEKQTVERDGHLIRLTRKEFNLLEYMMKHKGMIVSRPMLMEHVWTADSDLLSNTIEAHIRNVRRKINVKNKPDLIANIPGRGYVLDTPQNLKKLAV